MQRSSFHLKGKLYNRMKDYLASINVSQTEWLEMLIRNELARKGA